MCWGSSFQRRTAATLKARPPILDHLNLVVIIRYRLEERSCLLGLYQLNFSLRGPGPRSCRLSNTIQRDLKREPWDKFPNLTVNPWKVWTLIGQMFGGNTKELHLICFSIKKDTLFSVVSCTLRNKPSFCFVFKFTRKSSGEMGTDVRYC